MILGKDFCLRMEIVMNFREAGENCSKKCTLTSMPDLPRSHLGVHFHCCMHVSCQHFTKTFLSETVPQCGDISSSIKKEDSCTLYRCIRGFFIINEVLCSRQENLVFISCVFLRVAIVKEFKARVVNLWSFFHQASDLSFMLFHTPQILLLKKKKHQTIPPLENWKQQRRNIKSSGKIKQ